MPRPKTPEYWEERVREIRGRHPEMSVAAIEIQLQREQWPEEAGDPPRGNTIRRILARTPNPASYRPVSWPESFGSPELPWESAATFFELWRHLRRRPSLRLVQAFWRVSLASAPDDASTDSRYRLAAASLNDDPRDIERGLLEMDYSFNPQVSFVDEPPERTVERLEEVAGGMSPEERAIQEKLIATAHSVRRWKVKQDEPQG